MIMFNAFTCHTESMTTTQGYRVISWELLGCVVIYLRYFALDSPDGTPLRTAPACLAYLWLDSRMHFDHMWLRNLPSHVGVLCLAC